MTLRDLRESRSMTQREVAEECGVTPLTVGNWERGVQNPYPPQVRALAKLFNLSIPEMQEVLRDSQAK